MSESVAQPAEERRRFFRVTDLVGLKFKVLDDGETELAIQAQPTSLKSLLASMETEISSSMAILKNAQPEIHKVLDLLNQKLNLAFGHGLLANDADDVDGATQACQVNLSACGIAFPVCGSIALNQHISLELTLYPSNVRMQLLAACIACEELPEVQEGNTHLVRADFVGMSDLDHEALVQHVIKRQVQELKESRED